MDVDYQGLTSQLLEMGFEEAQVKLALEKAPMKTIEGLVAFIESAQNGGPTGESTKME